MRRIVSRLARIAFRGLLPLAVLLAACTQSAPEPPPPAAPAPPPPAPAEAAVIDIPNVRTPRPGVLSGGQPTAEQLAQAGQAGYRTVVNLRPPGEQGSLDDETSLVEAEGMRYVAIPVAGAAGLTEENVRQLAAVLDDPENLPVMVHCASGNRVGALLALGAHQLDGVDADAALELGRQAGLTRLEEAVRELLADEP